MFRRDQEGHLWADDFLDEADICPAAVAQIDAAVVRLERRRLTVENGYAVYVPAGALPFLGCVRVGRLYLRRAHQ